MHVELWKLSWWQSRKAALHLLHINTHPYLLFLVRAAHQPITVLSTLCPLFLLPTQKLDSNSGKRSNRNVARTVICNNHHKGVRSFPVMAFLQGRFLPLKYVAILILCWQPWALFPLRAGLQNVSLNASPWVVMVPRQFRQYSWKQLLLIMMCVYLKPDVSYSFFC